MNDEMFNQEHTLTNYVKSEKKLNDIDKTNS